MFLISTITVFYKTHQATDRLIVELFIPRPAVSADAIESVNEKMAGIESSIEDRLSEVTSKLENLTFTIKKAQPEKQDKEVICNHCFKPGHYSTQCPDLSLIHI